MWDGSDGEQVWLSQQAASYGVTTIYADAWSAPAFMKTNGAVANGGYLCGVTGETCSSGSWIQAAGGTVHMGAATPHGYAGTPGSPFSFTSLPVWQTEWADLSNAWSTSWAATGTTVDGLMWALRIRSGLVSGNLSAFLYWIGAEPTVASSSAVLVSSLRRPLWLRGGFGLSLTSGDLSVLVP